MHLQNWDNTFWLLNTCQLRIRQVLTCPHIWQALTQFYNCVRQVLLTAPFYSWENKELSNRIAIFQKRAKIWNEDPVLINTLPHYLSRWSYLEGFPSFWEEWQNWFKLSKCTKVYLHLFTPILWTIKRKILIKTVSHYRKNNCNWFCGHMYTFK